MVSANYGKLGSIKTLDQAKFIWRPIFDKYNLTKRGLRAEGYEIREKEYDDYIRQGEELYITRDDNLVSLLSSLPLHRKYVFSNGPETSIAKCLDLLGIAELIDGVYGTDFHDSVCKPEVECFVKVLEDIGMRGDEGRILYFEDSYKNLIAGKDMGMNTCFVRSKTLEMEGRGEEECAIFDVVVEDIGRELKGKVPELWEAGGGGEGKR